MATLRTRRLRSRPPLRRPTEDEIKQAQEATRRLDLATDRSGEDRAPTLRVTVRDEDATDSELEIPPLALTLLEHILEEMARGNAVVLESLPRLLTIHQAADLLGVSRFFVTDLIDKGELACQIDGTQQRIVFEELMAYKQSNYEARSKVLDELVAEAQELGMGY
jgi:excisionase family DNA binding protein